MSAQVAELETEKKSSQLARLDHEASILKLKKEYQEELQCLLRVTSEKEYLKCKLTAISEQEKNKAKVAD